MTFQNLEVKALYRPTTRPKVTYWTTSSEGFVQTNDEAEGDPPDHQQ